MITCRSNFTILNNHIGTSFNNGFDANLLQHEKDGNVTFPTISFFQVIIPFRPADDALFNKEMDANTPTKKYFHIRVENNCKSTSF